MKWILTLLMVAVMCSFVWQWQMEGNLGNIAMARGKSAADRAAHDASLQIDKPRLGDGQIVFDRVKAGQAFRDTLMKNMELTNSLIAKQSTLYKGEVEIVFADYIDDSNVVSRFGSPFSTSAKLYQRQTTKYNIQKMIYGPAVVYVIRFKKPLQQAANDQDLYLASIFEYPNYN